MNHTQMNINLFLIILASIISFITSKLITFNLKYGAEDKKYAPFYIDGKCKLDQKTEWDISFAVSLLSPAVGYYGYLYPHDYKIIDGTPSLLNFKNVLNMELRAGKKAEGKIVLFDNSNSRFTSDIISYLYDYPMYDDESYEKEEGSLGLSYSMSSANAKGFENSETTWAKLKKSEDIDKIFSINKWTQEATDPLRFSSQLFLGGRHENFDKDENVGTFNIFNTKSPFWNTNFATLILNGKNISLSDYEIRFMVENKTIAFPRLFKEYFVNENCNITNTKAYGEIYICYINSNQTLPITFVNSNDTIVLIGEIDNLNYLLPSPSSEIQNTFATNIKFINTDEKIIYMPLTVFKKFHVLFDGTAKNQIKFYTTDQNLLKKINRTEPTPEPEKEPESGLLDYILGHLFSSIIIFAIVLVVCALMVSICRSDSKPQINVTVGDEGITDDD